MIVCLCVCVCVCVEEEDVVVPGSAAVAHPGPETERERERIKDIRMKGRIRKEKSLKLWEVRERRSSRIETLVSVVCFADRSFFSVSVYFIYIIDHLNASYDIIDVNVYFIFL